jgi:hypothetical protein
MPVSDKGEEVMFAGEGGLFLFHGSEDVPPEQ